MYLCTDPSDPPQDPVVEDYDKDYVELGWKPPANDGGAPIQKYVIEKCEKGIPKWEHVRFARLYQISLKKNENKNTKKDVSSRYA